MEIGNIIPHIEAVIFASDKAMTSLEITEVINNAFGFMEDKIVLDQVESAIEGIIEKYNSEFYPFEIRQSGGGWQFLTKKDYHKTIAQLNGDKFLKRLSSAALETLAIIAYKQPITKSEIESIRGVNCDYAVQRLLEKELVVITGRNENMPGKPLIYTTSKSFMDYFGINSADDLPKIKEILAEQAVEATYLTNGQSAEDGREASATAVELVIEEETAAFLAVTPDGELISAVEEETVIMEETESGEAPAAEEDAAPEELEQEKAAADETPAADTAEQDDAADAGEDDDKEEEQE